MPTTLLNYACGLSRARDFVAGSAVGGAPRVFASSGLGASGGDLTSVPALLGLGIVAMMALVALAVALRRRMAPSPAR